MARDATKRASVYRDAELQPELIIGAEVETHASGRNVARLALLWRERRFLFRWAALGLAASTLLVFLIPVRYTSTTQLMPPDQVGEGLAATLGALTKGGSGGELASLGTELLGLRTSSDLFIGVLHSRTVEDDLINKFDLRKVYRDRRIEDVRKDLTSRTDISGDRKSGIVTIKVNDRDPQRAAAMAREYVDQLNQIVVTLNTSSAHKERVFLENRLQQVQQDLESAEKDFGQFASKNTALDVKEQGRAMIGAEAELEGQLISAQTQLEGLRQIYTNENVRVRTLQARIGEYRRQLQKLNGNASTATDDATPQGETQSDQLYPTIRQLPILGVPWADLYRRAKVQEVVFETLTKQYEIAKVEEAREVPSVKVLDPADVPEQKSFPPRMLLIFSGTVLTILAAGSWVLMHDRWRKVDASDPRKALALDVMQTVERTRWVSQALRFVRNGTPPVIRAKHDDAAQRQGQEKDHYREE
jgi:capsule polysaccharide export protein KpsE/RkpR